MIDHIEAVLAGGQVHGGDIYNAVELAAFVIAEKGHELNNVVHRGCDRKLAVNDSMFAHRGRQRAGDGLAKPFESLIHAK